MPITNYSQLARFFAGCCSAEIPPWMRLHPKYFGDDIGSIKAFGLQVTINLCETLLIGGAPGLYFFSMNQVEPTNLIWRSLNLTH